MMFEKRSSGKILSMQNRWLRFLIDESLSPNVAQALKLVRYDSMTVTETFTDKARVLDPDIIDWCKDHDAVWVHADDKARKEHGKQIITSGIAFLWIYRPGGIMSAREELRLLSYVLPDFIDRLGAQPKRRHYRASAHGQSSRPRIHLQPVDIVRGKVKKK